MMSIFKVHLGYTTKNVSALWRDNYNLYKHVCEYIYLYVYIWANLVNVWSYEMRALSRESISLL